MFHHNVEIQSKRACYNNGVKILETVTFYSRNELFISRAWTALA